MSYKCAAAGCEYTSLDAADMKRHMALEHVLVVKNADGTGTTQRNALIYSSRNLYQEYMINNFYLRHISFEALSFEYLRTKKNGKA